MSESLGYIPEGLSRRTFFLLGSIAGVTGAASLAACSSGEHEPTEVTETTGAPGPTASATHETETPSSPQSRELFERGTHLATQAGEVVLGRIVSAINGDVLAERDEAPVRNLFAIRVGEDSTIRLSDSPFSGPTMTFIRQESSAAARGAETWTEYSLTPAQYENVKLRFANEVTPGLVEDLASAFKGVEPVYVGERKLGSDQTEDGSMFSAELSIADPRLEGDAVYMGNVRYTPGEFADYAEQVRTAVLVAGKPGS